MQEAENDDDDALVRSDWDTEDMFERNEEDSVTGTKLERAVEWLREELEICETVTGKHD